MLNVLSFYWILMLWLSNLFEKIIQTLYLQKRFLLGFWFLIEECFSAFFFLNSRHCNSLLFHSKKTSKFFLFFYLKFEKFFKIFKLAKFFFFLWKLSCFNDLKIEKNLDFALKLDFFSKPDNTLHRLVSKIVFL